MSDALTDVAVITALVLVFGWWLHGPLQESWNLNGKQNTLRQNLTFWGILATIDAVLSGMLILGWNRIVFGVLVAFIVLFMVGLMLALAHWRA